MLGKKRGPKVKPGGAGPVRVGVTMSRAERRKLYSHARLQGQSFNGWARQALIDLMEHEQ